MASTQAKDLLKLGLSSEQRHALRENNLTEVFKHLSHSVQQKTVQLPAMHIAIPGGMLELRAYRLENLTAGSDVQQPDMTTIHIAKKVPVAYRVFENMSKFKLSVQEQRVAWLLCQGNSSAQIEQQLSIKDSTYHTYIKRLLSEYQVNSQAELVNVLTC